MVHSNQFLKAFAMQKCSSRKEGKSLLFLRLLTERVISEQHNHVLNLMPLMW